jgi:RNA polymerase sigma factor (sigma-70 family)
MDEHDWLAEQFESHRARLTALAHRMLGSRAEADDAVQEAWLRLSRTDVDDVANLGGWLTTVVARVSLDLLRARASRRTENLDEHAGDPLVDRDDPEQQALVADAVGPALLVVLDTLGPAERVAFVLHDMFSVPFEEVARIVGRSPAAARQLASRARRRVHGASDTIGADGPRRRAVVEAFLAASRDGDFAALLALLDPHVVLRADAAAVRMGATPEVRGAQAVADTFAGRARVATPALVDGTVNAVWAHGGGRPRVVFGFVIVNGAVMRIELIADPDRLESMDVVMLEHRDKDQPDG